MSVFPTTAPSPIPIGSVDQWGRVWDGIMWRCPVGIPEAPQDGRYYGRVNGTWGLVIGSSDDSAIGDFTVFGNLTVYKNIYGQENFELVGNANIGGQLTANEMLCNGDLTVEGGTDIGGGLEVQQYINCGPESANVPAGQGSITCINANVNQNENIGVMNQTAGALFVLHGGSINIMAGGDFQMYSTETWQGPGPDLTFNINGTGDIAKANNGYFSGAVTASNITASSDRRSKTNIQPADEGLDVVRKIHARRFQRGRGVELGLVAQDVQGVVPDAVRRISPDNSQLGIDVMAMIALLVNSVNELAEAVAELQRRKPHG